MKTSFIQTQVDFEKCLWHLSHRRLEVLKRHLRGQSDAEIAASLYIDRSTVRQHIKAITRIFGLKNLPGERFSLREDLLRLFQYYKSDWLLSLKAENTEQLPITASENEEVLVHAIYERIYPLIQTIVREMQAQTRITSK